MVTVAHLVEKIIKEKPFLEEALSRGILNNAALAEELTPKIEAELSKKVNFSAINMAIRRLGEKLHNSLTNEIKFDEDADISIQSDLLALALENAADLHNYLQKLPGIVNYDKGDFLTITQGKHETLIVTNKKYERKILDILPPKAIKKAVKDIGSLTIRVEAKAIEKPGLFYIITRALIWENINIVEIVPTFTEMTFIFKEKDIPRAYSVLKQMIKSQ